MPVRAERGAEIVAALFVKRSEADPERGFSLAARALGELRLDQIDELVVSPAARQHVREFARDIVAGRVPLERSPELRGSEVRVAAHRFELSALEQRIHRRGVIGEFRGAAQVERQFGLVAGKPLDICEIEVDDRVARE